MLTHDLLLSLFAYTADANTRLLACAATLPEAVLHAPRDYSIGSVHTQLFHIAEEEAKWVQFFASGQLDAPRIEDYPTLDAVRDLHTQVSEATRAYLTTLSDDAALARSIVVLPPDGAPHAVWQALMQVIIHGADHRAQTLAALHALGAPTFEQDYTNFLEGWTQGTSFAPDAPAE